MRQWRVIYDEPLSGQRNMAVDEAILNAVIAGRALPTLRLYAWDPPCLSLGYGQPVDDVDEARLSERGWQVVRRPTGGKAILHADELTYSVAMPATDELAQGDIVTSYRRISAALMCALESLGLTPSADPKSADAAAGGAVCFEVPSHYEITSGGRKLIGSAQMRRRGGVLQHGSLPLHGDIARICEVLTYPDEASRQQAQRQVRARATTLYDALGIALSWHTVAHAVERAFAETFSIAFTAGTLTQAETENADSLMHDRYAVIRKGK